MHIHILSWDKVIKTAKPSENLAGGTTKSEFFNNN